jgi:hypothetical protein
MPCVTPIMIDVQPLQNIPNALGIKVGGFTLEETFDILLAITKHILWAM